MKIVDTDEAKKDLSRLVEAAAAGEPFIIAKSGKPFVRVVAVDAPFIPRPVGFMTDQKIAIPDDFDRMHEDEIAELFEGGPMFPDR